jgi:GrpB-like predicted nucleotidyltransferase (UPF0157 family)
MIIEKYTSTWIKYFDIIKREIETELHGLDFTIEHIGSTSVPNLDSKPIIDIDIIYPKDLNFEKLKSELLRIGYFHNGNQGIENREVFKRRSGTSNEMLDKIVHHLYVCPVNSKALERHILFRNFLRRNEWALMKYQQMKYELAEQANQDRKKYAELKEKKVNDFIDLIIEKEKKEHTTML